MAALDQTKSTIEEEIEALQAIFCEEGELTILSDIENGLFARSETVDMSVDVSIKRSCATIPETRKIRMTVILSNHYPHVIPKISLSSAQFQNKEVAQFRDDLLAYAESLPPGPMILDLIFWLQEHVVRVLEEKEEKTAPSEAINELVVIKVDHMRNRTQYLSTLTSWTQDLDLKTAVIFLHKLILVVSEGLSENMKEFLRRFKTSNIDVDSSGRPCKERMMSFIVQMQRHFKLK